VFAGILPIIISSNAFSTELVTSRTTFNVVVFAGSITEFFTTRATSIAAFYGSIETNAIAVAKLRGVTNHQVRDMV